MKNKVNMRHAVASHLRGIRELHKVSPKFFPILTLHCIISAMLPYITVFFSAQILKELATLRRADILWHWVILSAVCVGIASIMNAILQRRCNTLLNDLWGRKEILFIHKMFSLDFSELDKQENHDLREQIQQNENWSSWGLMRVKNVYEAFVTSVIGILSGIALTVSLFSSPVPDDTGWLTALNNPLFILALAILMVGVSILAGKFRVEATKCWSDFAEEATFGNRLFGHFGFVGMDKERSIDIRMNRQQNLIRAYLSTSSTFGVQGPVGRSARAKWGSTQVLACA